MLFKEYKPAPILQEWIECYWKFVMPPNTAAPMQPVCHIFPPEGSCSLLFIKIPALPFQEIRFAGPSTQVHEVDVFPASINVGIRLKPGYSACLNAAHPLTILNATIPVSGTPQWQSAFLDNLSLDFDAPAILDDLLTRHCLPVSIRPDARIIKAVDLIIENAGDISVNDISQQCFLGIRQLQRLFTQHTGISIKHFCQIRRLRQAIIDLYVQRRPCSEIAAERGFTDPAHFYKSFRNVAAYKLDKFLDHINLIDHQLL